MIGRTQPVAPVILTVVPIEIGFLVHEPDDTVKVKPFDRNDHALDFLAWCSANRCTASPLFSLSIHYRGGRCCVIEADDDDAALALRLRWL